MLGIDIGEDFIKIVEVERSKEQKILKNMAIIPLPEGAITDTERIRNAFLVNGLSAKQAVVAVGGRNIFFREVKFPYMEKAELADTVKWEIGRYVPYEENTYYYDFAVITENKEKNEIKVMLSAGKKAYIDDLLNLFSDLSVNIVAIEDEAFALSRLVLEETDYIIVVTGKTNHRIMIYQNQIPVISRNIANCGDDAAENKLQLAVDEMVANTSRRFVNEISRTIEYYKVQNREVKINKIFFCGEAENLPEIIGQVAQQIERPVSFIDALQGIAPASCFDKDYLRHALVQAATAIGLILREDEP